MSGPDPKPAEPVIDDETQAMPPDRAARFAWSDEDLPYLIVHKAEAIDPERAPGPARLR